MSILDMQEEPKDLGPRRPKNHHTITTVLGAGAEANDPDLHYRGTTMAHDIEEDGDPNPQKYIYDNEDDEIEMGAACFTHRVRGTPVPKRFKLPHDQQKYDRSQEPQSWMSDYLQAVKILGGSKETAMQSLQLHLTGAAQSWLGTLGKEIIGS
jgi:hypothetical protein